MALLQATKAAFDLQLEVTRPPVRTSSAAAEAPLKQIAINAGLEGGVVAEKVSTLDSGWGLNAAPASTST